MREEFSVFGLCRFFSENYRCPPLVIKLANALIEKNLNRSAGKKPLKAVKQGESGDVVRVFRFNSIDEEANWIAHDILKRSMEERANCAILARTKKLLDLVGRKIEGVGLPIYFVARKDQVKSAP